MRLLKSRKGNMTMWIMLLALFLLLLILILQMGKIKEKAGDMGESVIKLLNTFESGERAFFYMDASIELAAKIAAKETIEKSGYQKEIFKRKVQNPNCGQLKYPVIDSAKPVSECFPDYETAFKIIFTKNMNRLFVKYAPFDIMTDEFTTIINKKENEMIIIVDNSDFRMPVFSNIESFYRMAEKTVTSKADLMKEKLNEEGYTTTREYSTLAAFQRDALPTKIIIHASGTENVKETYEELSTSLRNYHYVIERDGKVYSFAPETKYTKHSECKKSESATCMIENTDKESIAIALISTEKDKIITGKQLDSLKKLIAETTSRNPDIKLDGASILFDKEVDASRKDPELSSENKAAIINGAAELKKTMNVPAENKEGEEGEEDDGTGNVIAITARVTDEDLSKYDCFPKIRTTKYFTPSCEDYTQWTSGSLPCSDGRGYCCIPEGVKRGVYEETRCQGSMSCRGQVYSYSTISKQGLAQSTPIPGVTRGLTHEGTDATPKRTVAADPNCPGFNYGSKIYIYWGEDNPWNGPYIVEDTGSAFKGRCDKLDIYVGVGKTALADAPIGDYAKVCILDENFKMPEQDFSSYSEYVDTITGDYSSRYSHDTKVYNMTKLFEKTKSFLDGTIQSCKQAAEEQKDACINNKMLSAEGNGLKVERCDVDTYKGIDLINSLPAAENPGPISPDFSKKILGEIIEEPKIGIVFGETSGEESEDYLAAVQQYNEQTQQQSEQETQTLRILAIGDSMTGAGSPSYPDQLKGILNKQGITAQIDKRHYDSCGTTIIKQCLQGAQINECQNSCRESANYNFANVDLTNYDIIIIWGSINNIGNPDQVINDLKEMYAYAKQRDKFVIAVTVAPREGYAPNVEKVNEFILNSPANVDYVVSVYDDLVDESTGGIKQEYVSSDGIHQNSAANTLIAQKIYQTAFLESISVNTEDDVRESDLLQTMGGSIVSASILLTDETGTVKINLTGEALEWINYSNTESELYISGDMLSKGDSIVANIKYDVNSKTYYIDQFSDIIANPEDIEGQEFLLLFKTLGECATSGETCRCTTPNMRILKEVSIANDTFTNTRTGEVAATQFKVQQNITLDMTNEHSLIIAANPLNQGNLLLTSSDQQNIPECIPKQKYKYICASLVGDEDLGTIGYALKI